MNTKFFITLTAVLLPIAFGPRAVSAEPLVMIVATNGTPDPDGIGRINAFNVITRVKGPKTNSPSPAQLLSTRGAQNQIPISSKRSAAPESEESR